MTRKKQQLPDEEANVLQTETENATNEAIGSEDGAEEMENLMLPQTDSEGGASDGIPADGKESAYDQSENPQTDSQNDVNEAETTIGPESEPLSKPARKRKTPAKKNESDTEAAPKPEAKASAPKRTRKAASIRMIQEIVSIDDVRSVETDEDKAKNDLLDLTESMKAGKILTGTVHGVERTADDAVAVIYHGAYKVIIPTYEAIVPPSNYRDIPKAEVHEYLLTKRLGAEFDYIVKGIDTEARVAVASRIEAMKIKRKWHYYDIEKEAGRFLYEGVIAEARVVSAIRTGIFVDLFGVETFIPLRELDYQRLMDASLHFSPGQRVLVKVLTIDRKDRNNIQVTASVKQTTENPCIAAIRKYTVGDKYVGTVSMIDTNGVFVALDGGIDCLCSYPKRGRPPRGARVTVLIRGKDMTANRIWGVITHIAIAR